MKKQLLNLFIATSLCSLFIAPSSSFAQVPNYVPTNGLVGYWPFNGNANDESGNGNNGTVNGATLTTDRFGNSNSAYNFNDGNSIATSYYPSNVNSTTYSAWFKTSNGGCIIGSNAANSTPNLTLAIHTNSTSGGNIGTALWVVDHNGSSVGWMSQQPTNNLFSDDVWHNIVGVYNCPSGSIIQPNNLILYVDGQIITTISQNVNPSSSPLNIFSNIVFGYNGRWVNEGFDGKFIGKIDDIGIWNRALTQCEIQDLYNAQLNSVAVNAGTDQTLCEGQSTSLFGSGASTYTWNNNVQNGVGFVPTTTSSYTVTGTDANGCIGTDTVNIVVNNNSSSTLNETALDSYTLNGQTYAQSGTYTQNLPNAAGCDSTITLNLTLNFTGLNELENTISIAPNPATDQLTISSSSSIDEKYILFDPQGRAVLSGKLSVTTTQLDLSKLARGNYLLQIGEKKTPVKLVKE